MMDPAEARVVLGVASGAPPAEVRAAYLRLVMENHPDRGASGSDGRWAASTARTARITEAYAALRSSTAPPGAGRRRPSASHGPGRPGPIAPPGPPADLGDVRRVCLGATVPEAFQAVLDALHVMGHVSYQERLSAVLEVVVTPVPGEATSMLVVLETPQDAHWPVPDEWDGPVTVATLCVEPLGRHRPAPLDDLVEGLAALLASDRPAR